MPAGKPNKQTIATMKYQAKNGIISKSYKLKKALADEFARTCMENGESQAAVISRLMENYIKGERLQ